MIKKCLVVDIFSAPNIEELLEEYAQESAIDGLPHPSAKREMYQLLEDSGTFQVFAAFQNSLLIGFITVLVPVLPHYGVCVAVVESFFVSKDSRKTGAGIRLKNAAEKHATEKGSAGILYSAPLNGILAELLPRLGCVETNRVFFRKL